MEEREGIARLKRGDINGLEPLVRQYQLRAIRAAFAIVRDRQLAEDITQTAFVRVYERIAQFDTSRAFGPWFFRIIINDALKAVDREGHQQSLEGALDSEGAVWAHQFVDPEPSLFEQVAKSDNEREIWAALDQLTPIQRTAIVMRYYLDLNVAEMTVRLKRPSGTVKWLLYIARERLRDLLNAYRSQPDIQSASQRPDDE